MTATRIEEVQARYRRILSALPEDLHLRAKQGMHTNMNLGGGRPSDALHDAVQELLAMHANSTLSEETSWERIAREYREARR